MAILPEPSVLKFLSSPHSLSPQSNPRELKPPASLHFHSSSRPHRVADGAQVDLESELQNTTSTSTSNTGASNVRKDRRRVVRIAWEKLVRWSRSWRSKAKMDVLERTKKVSTAST